MAARHAAPHQQSVAAFARWPTRRSNMPNEKRDGQETDQAATQTGAGQPQPSGGDHQVTGKQTGDEEEPSGRDGRPYGVEDANSKNDAAEPIRAPGGDGRVAIRADDRNDGKPDAPMPSLDGRR
jgi:hypothetical protein